MSLYRPPRVRRTAVRSCSEPLSPGVATRAATHVGTRLRRTRVPHRTVNFDGGSAGGSIKMTTTTPDQSESAALLVSQSASTEDRNTWTPTDRRIGIWVA